MGHNLDLCKKKVHQHACKVSHCHYKKYEWNIVNEGCAFWIVNDVISQTFCYPSSWMCFLLKIWGAREVKLNLVEIIQGTLRDLVKLQATNLLTFVNISETRTHVIFTQPKKNFRYLHQDLLSCKISINTLLPTTLTFYY